MATDETNMASMPGRYAGALFDLAKDMGKVDDVEGDLTKLEALLHESDDLRRLVRSPVFSTEDQGRALTALMSKAGIGELTANFVNVITRNRRLFALPQMIGGFKALAAAARGEITAEVTTAQLLTDEQAEALKSQLKASLGKDVRLDSRVDPAILGGLIVRVGSRMIDSSLRMRLASLKAGMKAAG